MSRKFAVVTTFNEAGYMKYGRKMIETYLKNWPAEVTLHLYPEKVNPLIADHSRITLTDLDTGVPSLQVFKNKWKGVPHANGDISGIPRLASRKDSHKPFKWDAVRFAHKVYSIFHCAQHTDADVLIWMDADMICHSPITLEKINSLIPQDADLCFLGRDQKFTECGLYSMNLRSPATQSFLVEFQRMYDQAETGIFTLDEWHDSYVFDAARRKFPTLKQVNWSRGIIKGEGHPLINCEWGAYLDHLKGDRKITGKSPKTDLRIQRTEAYWR